MSEKRKQKRRQLLYYPKVFVRDTDYLLGKLADITQGGIMITGERPVETGGVLPLQIMLPEKLYNCASINLEAKCLRCRKEGNTGRYSTGFQIVNILENDRLLINRMILEYRIP